VNNEIKERFVRMPSIRNNPPRLTYFSLLIPIFLENILRNFMGTANTLLLSRVSDEAVSSVGVANQYITTVLSVLTLLFSGCAVALNQALGHGPTFFGGLSG
jgi:Na+-driven multidrug efflux pump